MKKLIFIIILFSTFICGCATCETKYIVKTKIVAPTIACAQPLPYEEFKETLVSTDIVHSEGVLFEVISTNVKMMERQIMLWENYKDCVEKTIKLYKEAVDSEDGEKEDDK